MREGWKEVTVGCAFETITGSTPSKANSDFYGDFMLFVKPPELNNGIIEYTSDGLSALGSQCARILPPNSIFVSCIGILGKVGINRTPAACNQQINVIKPNCEIAIPFYVFYYCLSDIFVRKLKRAASGTTVPIVNKSKFNNIEIPLPPLAEQKRIVEILDEAFAAIERARANTEKNLANARDVFERELTRIFAFKGEGWEEKKLNDIGKTQTGSTPKTSHPENFGDFIPFVKPADFNEDGSLNFKSQGLSEIGLKTSRLIRAGSVLMVCIGATIGKTGFVDKDVCANQQINALTPVEGISSKFIYYQFLIPTFQKQVIANSGQATLPIINKSKWSNLTIWLPPTLEEQKEIVRSLDELRKKAQDLKSLYSQKLALLSELEQSLLHKAFTGALTADFDAVDRALEEAGV